MLVVHNWYSDKIYVAFDDEEAIALSIENRRLRYEAKLRVVFDGVLCRHVPSVNRLDVWGGLWHPAVEKFIAGVGETCPRLDWWHGEVLPRRCFGRAWEAHADLRQEKIGARPCQMGLNLFGSGDVARLFGIPQSTAHKRIRNHAKAVNSGKRWFLPAHVAHEVA